MKLIQPRVDRDETGILTVLNRAVSLVNPQTMNTLVSSTVLCSVCVLLLSSQPPTASADPMKLWNSNWAQQFAPKSYDRPTNYRYSADTQGSLQQKFDAINYSPQGMSDLLELGDLVGAADPESLSLVRPYYSIMDMSANGNKQAFGSYIHVLPDEDEGNKPIYSVGGSLGGGIEPNGMKHGYLGRFMG